MGCFTKHVGKSTCLRKISTCFSGFFSGQVGARIDDIEHPKVKRYLFFNPAFFTFQGRFYQLACDGFLPIVPDVFVLHEGA